MTQNPNNSVDKKPSLEDFFLRLQNWVDKKDENKEIEETKKSQFIDIFTGRKLFSPKISKTSEDCTHHRNNNDLFEYLYSDKFTRENSLLTRQKNSFEKNLENSKQKLISENSDHINSLIKEDCFNFLFQIFDYKETNILECTESFIANAKENLDQNVLEIFYPILLELKEYKEKLYKNEFFAAIEELYKLLNVKQKRDLINFYLNKKRFSTNEKRMKNLENNDLIFKPKISENSEKYYRDSTRYSKDYFERNLEHNIVKEVFIKAKSQEKYNKELEGIIEF